MLVDHVLIFVRVQGGRPLLTFRGGIPTIPSPFRIRSHKVNRRSSQSSPHPNSRRAMTQTPCHNNTPCSQPPSHLSASLFPAGRGVPGMLPWTSLTSPLSPSSSSLARASGHQLPLRRAPMTPEQRQRRLQSILEAALDIMSSLDDFHDEHYDDDNNNDDESSRKL
jgi:hypothetical protein